MEETALAYSKEDLITLFKYIELHVLLLQKLVEETIKLNYRKTDSAVRK